MVGDGRVGLGSTTPNATQVISNDASNSAADLLQLVNSVGTYNFVVTNGGSVGIGMYNPSGYLTVYGNTYLAATEGNVGIGETSPGSKLSVSGNATIGANIDTRAAPTNGLQVEGDVLIGTAGTGVTQAGDVSIFGGDINLGYGFASSTLTSLHGRLGVYDTSQASTSPGAILSIHAATNTAPALLVNQTGTGELLTLQRSGVTQFIVNSFSGVGIATSSPGSALSVKGAGLLEGDLTVSFLKSTSTVASSFGGALGIATSSPWGLLSIEHTTAQDFRTPSFVISDQGTSTPSIYVDGGYGRVGFGTSSPYAQLSIEITGEPNDNLNEGLPAFVVSSRGTSTPAFYIASSNGNVGFSTSSPGASLSIGSGATALFSSTATTTFSGGINVKDTGGLSSATGLTITGGDIISSGKLTLTGASTSTIPQLNASTILTVPTLDVSTILKNSGTATSSFAGGLSLGTGGLNITSGGLYVDVGDVTFDQKLVVNGKVGIGTTNPNRSLEVASGTDVPALRLSRTSDLTQYLDIKALGADVQFISRTDVAESQFSFISDNNGSQSTRLFIAQSGNVGIGTTSPTQLLSVGGTN
ncbi:MAG: hypothetical protein AAB670_00480, partial [Patescibacteria group bacterium]